MTTIFRSRPPAVRSTVAAILRSEFSNTSTAGTSSSLTLPAKTAKVLKLASLSAEQPLKAA